MQQPLIIHRDEGWQGQLRRVITGADQLLALLDLRPQDVGFSDEACRDFPLKVPLAFVGRMRVADPRDPLLLQVLARADELAEQPGYRRDPVGETGTANARSGVIRKYRGRALLLVSGACAVHCRYCFRRHFPYGDHQNSREQWRDALAQLAEDPSIEEVILSGGDPLVATDRQLADITARIAEMQHVRRLRVHSRLPVVLPDRVTESLLDAISHPRLQTVMVIHGNHANEIDESVTGGIAAMRERDITVLNQSVLLAGVNDSADALVELSERLFAAGVLPYYLHLLDKVQGAAHFDVPEERARRLLGEIAARLPGYLVPKLAREVAGAPAKVSLEAIL